MAIAGGFDLGSAYAKVLIDESGVDSGISSIQSKFQSLGKGLQDVGASLTLVGAPFAALVGIAVKNASEAQDVTAQLDAVLKSTGGTAGVTKDQVLNLSSALQQLTTYGDEEITSAQNMLLTFTNIGQDVFPAATETVLDMSQALGQDLKSSSIQLGKALNDPIRGVTALQRVGVTFTEAQKEQIKALVESGDVMGAQKLILAELGKEFGGSAAAAADTFGGQVKQLQNRFGDLMETIGFRLMPIFNRLLDFVGSAITWFTDLDDSTQGIIAGVLAFGAALVVIGPILAGIGTALTVVGSVLGGLGAVIGVIMSPIGLLIAAGALIVAIFRDQIGAGIETFIKSIQSGADVFTAFINALYAAFGDTPIVRFIAGIVDAIKDFVDNFQLYASLIKLYAEYYFQAVVTAIQNVINAIGDWISKNPEFATAMAIIGGAVIILTGIMAAVPAVIGLISAAVGILTGALGILLSPAVLLIGAIAGIIYAAQQLYPGGIAQLLRDAATAAQQLAFLGMYVLAAASDWARARLAELLNTILSVISKIDELKNRLTTGIQGIGGIIGGVTSGQFSIGDVINAIGNEINGGRAYGGDVEAGMRYVVGERGPETFVAPANGSIVPNGDNAGGVHIENLLINASTEAGGRAAAKGFKDELDSLYRGRGNS